MSRHALSLLFVCSCTLCVGVQGDDSLGGSELTRQQLAVMSDAVAIARVGMASATPAADGGSLALWIERCLKGRLQSGRDIVWVPRKELAKAEPGPALWLLFLARDGDGAWHVRTGGSDSNAIKLDSPSAPVVAEVSKFAGVCGAAPEPEPPSDSEINRWINDAAQGSKNTRREAFAKLLAAGDSARPQLVGAASSSEREIASVARKLLPLTGGGPTVNGLRLVMEPAALALSVGERRVISVNLANLSDQEIQVVTGQAAWGDVVQTAPAYEVRAKAPEGAKTPSAQMVTVLPKEFGLPSAGSRPLPNVRVVPALSPLALSVEVELERATVDGQEQLRLKFAHGYVVLDGAAKYSVRVHFDCPGPRADQLRLLAANYWRGGQLVSNEITLIVK